MPTRRARIVRATEIGFQVPWLRIPAVYPWRTLFFVKLAHALPSPSRKVARSESCSQIRYQRRKAVQAAEPAERFGLLPGRPGCAAAMRQLSRVEPVRSCTEYGRRHSTRTGL